MVLNALLSSEKVNVIVVDWSVYASLSYANAVVAVPSVGIAIARVLSLLEAASPQQINFNRVHLVGFGLGAHAAGFAGRELQQTYNKRVARITGLDPSGNQWVNNPQRLRSSDARYVEAIHTDGTGVNANGIGIRVGHVDFFANGGGNQPGCSNNACSHNRAYELFSSSLTHGGLIGRECETTKQLTSNLCRGFNLELGNNKMNKFGDGMFRVNTGKSYPF
ncbi:hypothetical protein O3G_MSEX010868 [Manduca sexta]|nr:hypothetical protein O3G_MSEX010868 [Manduca sexta]